MNDDLKDFYELLLSEFHMVDPAKIDRFVSTFSDYLDTKIDAMVGTVHDDALQRIYDRLQDPERGQPGLHAAIMERPLSGVVMPFSAFKSEQ